MKSFSTYIILFIFPMTLIGQADTISADTLKEILQLINIPPVSVSANKVRSASTGSSNQTWNSTDLQSHNANNVAELLQQESGLFIKSYGINSLGTSSIRGGSAGHTLVLWNGLPIQSPMLGLLDLSLLPTNSAEEISVQKGGNTALWGSGAIGGVIAMKSKANGTAPFSLETQTTLGSFGEFQEQLKFSFGNLTFQSVTKLSHHQADNNFTYFSGNSPIEKQQSNARFSQQHLFQDFYWSVKPNDKIAVHFWQQFSDRQIPPKTAQTRSEAHQDDNSSRLIASWKHLAKRSIFETKIGLVNENLDFFDELNGIESYSNFKSVSAELNGQWLLNNYHRLHVGLSEFYTTASIINYENSPHEFKTAIFASHLFEKNKWIIQTSLRQELLNEKLVPIVPSFGLEYVLAHGLKIKGKLSRNYRLPTMNDRYWLPGGNINLQAESGWSEELSFVSNKGALEYSITGFNRVLNNFIMWGKLDGYTYWSAHNITKVWSRGLEPRISYHFKAKDFQFKLNGGYDYVLSTNQIAIEQPRIPEGSQLFYIPVHQAFTNIKVSFKNILFSYNHTFTGETIGINEVLPSYQIGNARIQYKLSKNKWDFLLFFNINNTWNSDYFVIERRPMPGRFFQTGLRINLN